MEFPRVISSSLRESFSRCPKKFYWDTIIGLTPKETSVHLTAGAAYAAAVEALRKEYYTTGDYDKAVALGLEALIKTYGPFDPPEYETKTLERTIAAYVEHLVQYPPATDHCRPTMGTHGPRVEFSFTLELPIPHPVTKEPILFSARFDQLAEFNGALFVFDDKTTGSISKYWRQQWDLRSQLTGYVHCAREHGYDVVGAIIRGMAILKTKCNTQEAITHRPQWMIDRWKERLIYDVERMVDLWNRGYWPNQGEENGGCTTYGLCNFFTLCTAQEPEHYIDVNYTRERWDPVDRDRKPSNENV